VQACWQLGPRLQLPCAAVPDRKQKGPAHSHRDCPEAIVLREAASAMRNCPLATEAFLKAAAAATAPSQQRTLDLWLLLALVQQGGKPGAAAEALVR